MIIIALRANGSTSNIERVNLYKDAGASSGTEGDPITGLTSASSGLIISSIANNEATATAETSAGSTIEGITTLGTFATPTSGKVRFKEVDSTNHPGLYELQFEDARYAVSSAKYLDVCITGVADLSTFHGRIYLDTMDAAGVRSAVGLAAADLDTQLGDIPNNAEFAARTTTTAAYATATGQSDITTQLDGFVSGAEHVRADVRAIIGATVTGTGTENDPWGP